MRIEVASARGTYPVHAFEVDRLLAGLDGAVVFIDSNVAEAWPQLIREPCFVVPAGETSKSLAMYERCLRWVAERGVKRSGRLVAVGGGVVGDLAGFVAATYVRGIDYVQVPTTLLAMVDSSVGGKVAVDLPEGKNLVGAFYPPDEVRVCMEVLRTLPDRELRAGMAEVWKTAAIMDADFYARLSNVALDDEDALRAVVGRCVELKAEVVQRDERETSGVRAWLNFGHTVAHAIETVTGYTRFRHGEAVAIGMVVESAIAEELGVAEGGLAQGIGSRLDATGLPTKLPADLDVGLLVSAMRNDKKATDTGLAFSLVNEIGTCKLYEAVPEDLVVRVLSRA